MFGNLFKSQRQRELDREIAMQRTLTSHRQLVKKLEKHERQYMEKALRAKKQGDAGNFGQLCGMVAQTINQRRGIESQLLRFETMMQKRDQFRSMKEFAGGLKAMASSISDVVKEVNADEMIRDVETSLANNQQMEATMDMVLDRISETGLTENVPEGGISANDVERIVGEQAAAEEASADVDKEIEAGLKAIERELTGEV